MSRSRISWFGAALVFLAAAAPPASAQGYGYRPAAANGLRLRLGLFTPEGGSAYWEEKTRDFTGEPDDFEDVSFGVEYQRALTPMLHLLLGGTFFEGKHDQAYRDFEDDLGRPIVHRPCSRPPASTPACGSTWRPPTSPWCPTSAPAAGW